jgi:hypothetical protein
VRGILERSPRLNGSGAFVDKIIDSCDSELEAGNRSSITYRDLLGQRGSNGQARIFKRKLGRDNPKLRESRHHPRFATANKVGWPEVLDFCGDLACVGRSIKGVDVVDGGLAGNQVLPEGVFAYSVWCHDAEPSDNNPSFVHRHLPKTNVKLASDPANAQLLCPARAHPIE